MEFPKPTRTVDQEYLDRIRRLPCSVPSCRGTMSDPHHVTSRGAGGSDHTAIPLCRVHHAQLHQLGPRRFESEHGISIWAVNARCLSAYVRDLKHRIESMSSHAEYMGRYVQAVDNTIRRSTDGEESTAFIAALCDEIGRLKGGES